MLRHHTAARLRPPLHHPLLRTPHHPPHHPLHRPLQHLLQDFLKSRRGHLGLSQEAVAERLHISARAYGNWERGTIKEWTDQKLYALAEVLRMSEFQTDRLFRYAVGRAPNLQLRAALGHTDPEDPVSAAFLDDYSAMLDALALPTFVVDQRWDIKMANSAYRDLFRDVRPHPTAKGAEPSGNFLRFGLFHPDAPAVFTDHPKWRLATLAQLASSLEAHAEDSGLRSIHHDVHRHPVLHDVYRHDMPNWVLAGGSDLLHHDSEVRQLRHPDPHVGLQGCRLVEETPRSLQALGLTRVTMMLVGSAVGPQAAPGDARRHHATQGAA
ncbi:helix-turn-helix domain-containing protein [Streptomyces venezuelae]|uniref:helix-turn-helix domain-containing protein n=1 Tax=Streptomyces venezuelae TaxID=54571 RepID=UPI0037ADA6A8